MEAREENLLKIRHSIKPASKTICELAEWLEVKFDLEQISLSEKFFSNAFITSVKFNAVHAITNENLHLSADDFQFEVYRIKSNRKSKDYYTSISFENNSPNFVYVILEQKSGYAFSNHGKLQLEIVIEQGVNKEDCEKESNVFLNYVGCIDMLQNGEY